MRFRKKKRIKWSWSLRLKTLKRRMDYIESMNSINHDILNVLIEELKKKGIIEDK
jgi:hypothetical protein